MNSIETESQGSKARSPVIDLEAEDISPPSDTGDTEPPKAAEEPITPPPKAERQPSFWSRHRGAIITGVIAVLLGAWFYRAVVSDLWPPSSMAERLSTLEASNHTFNEQLVALSGNLDALKADIAKRGDATANAAAGVETRLGDLDKAVAELRQSIAALGQNTGGGGSTADPQALAALTDRVAKLEEAVAALRQSGGATTTTTTTSGGEDQGVAQLTQALADLKAKFAAGLPYRTEFDRIAIYVPGNPDFAALEPYAETGITNSQALAAALEAAIPNLSKPGAGEPSASGGFWAWFGTVVKIRDLNTLDWADIARTAAADAQAGDLRSAIARLEEPGGDLPLELVQWRDKARLRLKAEGSMAQLAAAVTAVISGKP